MMRTVGVCACNAADVVLGVVSKLRYFVSHPDVIFVSRLCDVVVT